MSRKRLSRMAKLRRNLRQVSTTPHFHRAHGLAYCLYYGFMVLEDHGVHLVLASALLIFVGVHLVTGEE